MPTSCHTPIRAVFGRHGTSPGAPTPAARHGVAGSTCTGTIDTNCVCFSSSRDINDICHCEQQIASMGALVPRIRGPSGVQARTQTSSPFPADKGQKMQRICHKFWVSVTHHGKQHRMMISARPRGARQKTLDPQPTSAPRPKLGSWYLTGLVHCNSPLLAAQVSVGALVHLTDSR